jgi:uncharacterized membrane protein
MKLKDYKLILLAVGLVGILLIASPTIANSIRLPHGERFSELYLLGPNRMTENFPFNIAEKQNYTIYVGVGNHVGASDYYAVYVKFLDSEDMLPDQTFSPVNPMYKYRFFIQDEQTFESPLSFSISRTSVSNNQAFIGNIELNGENFIVDKASMWNSNSSVYHYRLLFELWKFNNQSQSLEYNNRFVYLHLNYTSA